MTTGVCPGRKVAVGAPVADGCTVTTPATPPGAVGGRCCICFRAIASVRPTISLTGSEKAIMAIFECLHQNKGSQGKKTQKACIPLSNLGQHIGQNTNVRRVRANMVFKISHLPLPGSETVVLVQTEAPSLVRLDDLDSSSSISGSVTSSRVVSQRLHSSVTSACVSMQQKNSRGKAKRKFTHTRTSMLAGLEGVAYHESMFHYQPRSLYTLWGHL